MFQTYDKLLSTEILSKLKVTIGPKTGGWVPLIVFHSHEVMVVLVYRGS